MTQAEALALLQAKGVILTDSHLVYTTGTHGSVYIQKDVLYPHVQETSALCEQLAQQVAKFQPDVVASPALGGIVLTQWVAHHLGKRTGKYPLAIYAEKVEGKLTFTRGYDQLVRGKRVVVLEDTTNTGTSALKVVELVRAAGGEVVGVGVLVNRQPTIVTTELFGAPLTAVLEFPAEIFEADACPLCKQGVPINTKIGHGKKFLEGKM